MKFLHTTLTPELYCSDIKTSLLFYIDVLGFNIQYQREPEGFAMLERQGSRIMLNEIRDETATNRIWLTAPLEAPFGRGINFQIQTENVESLYKKILSENINIFLPIEEKWYQTDNVALGQRQFIVLDPDGYMLRFYQDLGEMRQTDLK